MPPHMREKTMKSVEEERREDRWDRNTKQGEVGCEGGRGRTEEGALIYT